MPAARSREVGDAEEALVGDAQIVPHRNARLAQLGGLQASVEGGRVFYRPVSKSGPPAVDVNVRAWWDEHVSFKFVDR